MLQVARTSRSLSPPLDEATPGPTAGRPPPQGPLGGSEGCKCVGVIWETGEFDYHGERLPADFGGSCRAWDNASALCQGAHSPDFCTRRYCYVDPCECSTTDPPEPSLVFPDARFRGRPLYWSYSTCGDEPAAPWDDPSSEKVGASWTAERCDESDAATDEAHSGKAECSCRGIEGIPGQIVVKEGWSYPADVGSSCQAWDMHGNPLCRSASPPEWCAMKWCIVDPCQCNASAAGAPPQLLRGLEGTFAASGVPVHWSDTTCGEEPYGLKLPVPDELYELCVPEAPVLWPAPAKTTPAPTPVTEAGPSGGHRTQEIAGGSAGCKCIGVVGQPGSFEYNGIEVSRDFGGACKDWDMLTPACGLYDSPAFCEKAWCYVDPCACNASVPPLPSVAFRDVRHQGRPLYWSYAACGGGDGSFGGDDSWDLSASGIGAFCEKARPESKWGNDMCRCRGFHGIEGSLQTSRGWSYDGDAGSACEAWDLAANPDCAGGHPPSWCKEKWCYVDPCECDVAAIGLPPQPSVIGGAFASSGRPLYWSSATCGFNNSYGAAAPVPDDLCPSAPTAAPSAACDCTCHGDTYAPDDRNNPPNDCWIPSIGYDLPCCSTPAPTIPAPPLGPTAPTSSKAATTPSPPAPAATTTSTGPVPAWSAPQAATTTAAGPDAPSTGEEGCRCVGTLGQAGEYDYGGTEVTRDFGARCDDWDAGVPECSRADAPEHCSRRWCYVDPCECGAVTPPKPSAAFPGARYRGRPLYWSYAACGEEDVYSEAALNLTKVREAIDTICGTSPPEDVWGDAACRCSGLSGIDGSIDTGKGWSYDGDAGSACETWDLDANPRCKGDDPPSWCKEKWCYVDPCECDVSKIGAPPQQSATNGTLASSGVPVYWSYATCGFHNTYVAAEPVRGDICAPEATNGTAKTPETPEPESVARSATSPGVAICAILLAGLVRIC